MDPVRVRGTAVDPFRRLWHDPGVARPHGAGRPDMPQIVTAPTAQLPRSLPAWLPYLWSRVLFPGVKCSDAAIRRRSLLLLLVLPAALLYPCLNFHLFEPDEGRYA